MVNFIGEVNGFYSVYFQGSYHGQYRTRKDAEKALKDLKETLQKLTELL